METLKYDVLIIGYGVTGKLLATLLGKQGWNVGVIDPYDTPYGLPRAVKYNDEVMRNLQSIMADEDVDRISQSVPDHYTWVNADGETLLELDWSQDGISGWPADTLFNHGELEAAMDDARTKIPNVDARLGFKVNYLDEDEDGVTVYARKTNNLGEFLPDGEKIKAFAPYVIGADGANSFIRSKMDNTIRDLGFASTFYVIDLIMKEERVFSPTNLQVADPKRPTTLAMAGPGRRRWEFMLMPGETKEDFRDERTAWELLEPWDITSENAIIERHVVYTFNARWVEDWRQGRLILAGDAAHLTPPFLGQGLSSGIRDASNLAWKLDLLLKGEVDESILDTYTEERQPHMQTLIEAAVHLGKIITVADEAKAKERDDALLSGTYPPLPDLPDLDHGILYKHGENKLAGTLSLQAKVEYNNDVDRFDNLMGTGWKVIGLNNNPEESLDERQKELLEKLDADYVSIASKDSDSTDTVVDVEGKYEAYFKEHGIEAVVVRPDFYVYAGVHELTELNEIISELESQLPLKQTIKK